MIIGQPTIVSDENLVTYRVQVESAEGPDQLWYSVEKEYQSLVSELSDAALTALLIPAMFRGEDIRLEGIVSQRLLYNLSGRYQNLITSIIPSLQQIQIASKSISSVNTRASGVATGFSGGIDSFSALADHYYGEVRHGFKITHLLFNNVGSHGEGGDQLFRDRYARAKLGADKIGLPLIRVDSNLDGFYSEALDFPLTNTARNASVALLLQAGIGRFLYASSYDYKSVFVGRTYNMAYCDPISLPLLSTDSLDCYSVGCEYSRVQKTLAVADIPDSYQLLDVCTESSRAGNCSICFKCLRTLLTLEIAGMLDRYSEVFDFVRYRAERSSYIETIHYSNETFSKEIVEFAEQRGFPFSLSTRFFGWLKHLYYRPVAGLPIRIAARVRRIFR